MSSAFHHPLATLLTAIRFLTVIPIYFGMKNDGQFFQRSLIWFPAVGMLIGAVAAAGVMVLGSFLPPSVLAITAITLLAAVSGCLHLDGLADSGDGLLSARSKEKALEIMRDSRSGAMGVVALVIVLLAKYASLSTFSVSAIAISVFLMPIAGRTSILLMMAILPYARPEGGLGSLFYSPGSRRIAFAGILFCLISGFFFSWKISLLMLFAIMFTVISFSYWCYRKIGGATGDTLGAVCELAECAVAVSLSVIFQSY